MIFTMAESIGLANPNPDPDPNPNANTLTLTLMAESTTAELACCSRGVTRSMIDSASLAAAGLYSARESRMKTW